MRATGPREMGIVARPGQTIRRARTTPPATHPPDEETAGTVRALESRIFVKGLMLEAEIGVYSHEKGARRPLVIDIEIVLAPSVRAAGDQLGETVDYDSLVAHARAVAGGEHLHLIETFAERLAERILADPRIRETRIRVEKPGAVPGAACSGVEFARARA